MDQAACAVWHKHRVGRITGSISHRVTHASPDNPAQSIITDIRQAKNKSINTPWTVWGKHHEKDAIDTYRFILGIGKETDKTSKQIYVEDCVRKKHVNPQRQRAGFRICKERPYLGASCDGYVSCDCCGLRVLEAKWPYNWGQDNCTLQQWVEDKTEHLESGPAFRRIHAYFTQALHQVQRKRAIQDVEAAFQHANDPILL
ncbi:UNVERIFIED_CONTAM: hypothetical protein FKN15_013909 [Acipenser sinensis]